MYTQEKWRLEIISKLHGEYRVFANGRENELPKVIADVIGGLGVTEDACLESMANAHLIVAAPELLESLKVLSQVANRLELAFSKGYQITYNDHIRVLSAALGMAYESIRKAEGRSNDERGQ